MNLYYESMTKVRHQLQAWEHVTIRCWRQENVSYDKETETKNVHDIMLALREAKPSNQMDIANTLIKLDRMNAVEVLNEQDCGPVVYKDWP